MSEFEDLLSKLTAKFNNNKAAFYPYIEYIRFPRYKLLEKDTKIDFTFPVTLLVGKNGTNKTSILQALYGSPDGYSLGDYWFNTAVDIIDDQLGIDRHCLIYAYHHQRAQRQVEVLKTRIRKKNNPDYWEPSRPQKRYGMEVLTGPDAYRKLGSSLKTRWDGMKKKVLYCDCKEYVSAYDLFFYHYDFKSTKTQKTKQDYIRLRSKPLADAIKDNRNHYMYNRLDRVLSNIQVKDQVCAAVSDIMGESYEQIKIISHTFYTNSGGNKAAKTIWIKKEGNEYSEAFAGTGEARIILLVNDLINSPKNSLVLIDEPEISLHPSAIYKLKNFLLRQCLSNNQQIIITTHSTHLVEGFPREAIKLIHKSDQNVEVIPDIDYQSAFYELGDEYKDKKRIYVEDKLAKAILDFIISKSKYSTYKKNIEVKYLHCGAKYIITHHIQSSASKDLDDCIFLLDGDQKVDYSKLSGAIKENYLANDKVVFENIPEADHDQLEKIIKAMTNSSVEFKVSGNEKGKNQKELVSEQKKFIKYWEKYVHFLPFDTPENYLMKLDLEHTHNQNNPDHREQALDGKAYFEAKTRAALGYDEVSSEDIFDEQRRSLKYVMEDTACCEFIENLLKNLLGI